jgi:predicted RNA-binding protein with PUA-like domain
MPARHWLMKSEPDVFSIDDLAKRDVAGWDGVRNYQARNFMKDMKLGDRVFFYHSNALPPGIAGVAEVAKLAYPDPTQFDPKDGHHDPKALPDKPIWFQVDLRFVRKFPRLLSLDELRGVPALAGMTLFNRSRLSVQPVTAAQWKTIVALATRVVAS